MKIIGSKLRSRSILVNPVVWNKKKALLVGIKYDTSGSPKSDEFGTLDGPHNDVYAVRDLLIDEYGYAVEDIVMLLDGEGVDRNMQPMRVNIMRSLSLVALSTLTQQRDLVQTRRIQHLAQDARPGDHLVFLFAGHSTQLTCSERTEDDDMDEAIVPMDHSGSSRKSKLILDNWLRKHLIDPLKPGVQLIAFLDACHSGTLLDLDHNECNRVSIPWVNPGLRMHDTIHERVVRRDDTMIHSGSVVRFSPPTLSRAVSLDAVVARLTQQAPKLSRTPTFNFYRSRTATSLETARGRLAKPFRAVKFSVLKDVLRISIPRCKSPESTRKCDGQCEMTEKSNVPYVISFASCCDEQLTWENKRLGSMTQCMVKLLRNEPQPKLRKLIEELAYARHSASRQLHDAEKRRRKRARQNPQKAGPPLEGVNFQTVQIGSQQRLDLNADFEF